MAEIGDPLAGMHGEKVDAAVLSPEQGGRQDKLHKYRSMRDAAKTPEPVPHEPVAVEGDGNSFVIQEHHARRLHWDFRLERDGVLVSWAVPKGPPTTPNKNHLAVQTEDHPLDYGGFAGTIPKGEYGAGEVKIWDHGTYEAEKWRPGQEVIATVHGQPDGGLARNGSADRRFAFIHTGGDEGKSNWLLHLMKDQRPAERSDAPKDTAARKMKGTQSPDENPVQTASAAVKSRPAPLPLPDTAAVKADIKTSGMPLMKPMFATLGSRADVNDDAEWAFEMKWDGVRAIAEVTPDGTRLISRNGNDMTTAYPELQELGDRLNGERAVLDGEIVALNKAGRPDFGLLQPRMHLSRAKDAQAAAAKTPVQFMAFDLLWLDGNSLADLTYEQRREILEQAVESGESGGHVQVPPALDLSMEEAVAASKDLGLEGVVAKRRASDYSSGQRVRSWIKLKNQLTQEVVVVGWRPGQGNRANKVGSLLVAIPDGTDLKYIGRVGSGLSERDLAVVGSRLKKLGRKTAPLDDVPRADASDARWVRPVLVGEVTYAERTGTGKLRHPVWRGLRPDKRPSDVVPEVPEVPEGVAAKDS